MLALEAALQAAYAAMPDVRATMGDDLWPGPPGDGVPLPFVIMTVPTAPLDAVYGEAKHGQPTVQFAFYGSDRTLTGMACQAFCDHLDGAILPLTRGLMFFTQRLSVPRPDRVPDRDAVGGYVWRWLVQYRFAIRNP